MLIIPVKDGESIDRALKKYKRKFDKTGVVRKLRARQQFVKPSVTHRQKIQKQLTSKETLARGAGISQFFRFIRYNHFPNVYIWEVILFYRYYDAHK